MRREAMYRGEEGGVLVLKLKNEMLCISKYTNKNTITWCITRAVLYFCALRSNVLDASFNTTHQVKAIVIGISKGSPMAKLVIAPSLYTLHL